MELSKLVVQLENFISDDYCESILKWFLTNQPLHMDGGVSNSNESKVVSQVKKATQAYPHPDDEISHLLTKVISNAYEKYSKINPVPKNECITARDYSVRVYKKNDGYFKEHIDQSAGSTVNRIFAIILYLNDVYIGGETNFPDLGISVKPQKGKVLIFPCNYLFRHSGQMPISNDKYIFTAFINYCS